MYSAYAVILLSGGGLLHSSLPAGGRQGRSSDAAASGQIIYTAGGQIVMDTNDNSRPPPLLPQLTMCQNTGGGPRLQKNTHLSGSFRAARLLRTKNFSCSFRFITWAIGWVRRKFMEKVKRESHLPEIWKP
jgi:hypothetical protein